MTPTPPWNRKYPNWDRVIDDVIPLICTLLFGFSGTFFVSIAVADKAQVNEFSQTNLGWFVIPEIEAKDAILILSGISSIAFFASVLSAIYSKLSDADSSRPTIEAQLRSPAQVAVDRVALSDFHARQAKLRALSIKAFNSGVFVLPICGLMLLPKLAFVVALILYLVFAFALYRKTA